MTMSGTSSEDESDSGEELQVESLVSGRERRTNAGNRMATLLATEEPVEGPGDEDDDDLKLLFEENAEEEDAEFASGDDAVSDVEMDSSSDEDEGKDDDGEAGEKEIEREAKEERKRKRKAMETFGTNKKRKTADTKASGAAKQVTITTPSEGRPKKKVERVTWLPAQDDGALRASSRRQTMHNKQIVHERMKENEKRRKQQLKSMEAAAKRKEAEKSEPLTQEDKLAEAGRVEARNAKSLNRWEAAERKRVEEQRAKLAALKNKSLQGSIITIWSGQSRWVDGKCIVEGTIGTADKKKTDSKKGTNATAAKPNLSMTAAHQPQARLSESSRARLASSIVMATNLQHSDARWSDSMPGNPFHTRSGQEYLVSQQDRQKSISDLITIESRTLIGLDSSALREPSMQDNVLIRGRKSAIKIHGKLPEKEKCLITGLHARYRDPRTGVPYASIAAFKQLRANESAGAYTNGRWSTLLGQYVGADSDAPNAVPIRLRGSV